MADLVLRLRVDPVTGRRTIAIDYASDADALPTEHEEDHRKLAEKVIEGGLRNEKVEVSREQEAPVAEGPKGTAAPVATPVPQKR
ncbi:MAG: hypothetical protein H0T79_03700 [Deltaproteobacteria bacterium]|nr:hypothetical protein [Deltaproteobacteria bacterium]